MWMRGCGDAEWQCFVVTLTAINPVHHFSELTVMPPAQNLYRCPEQNVCCCFSAVIIFSVVIILEHSCFIHVTVIVLSSRHNFCPVLVT